MESKAQVQSQHYAADIETIKEAQLRIGPYIHKTPVLSSTTLDGLAGKRLYFKCECFQKGGAFKFRGASNAIFSLADDEANKGVVTHSSGNHAAAVSLAAKLRGIPAYIVIPKNAPKCKVENVKRYGGQVIWSETTMLSRESTASKVQQETGAVLIHPFNDTRIISGQGTISLELLEQVPEIDTIIVPISGGGLISGVTLAAKAINPAIRVLAAEPRGADDAAQSKAAGRIITQPQTNTIADGLRASLGDLTWCVQKMHSFKFSILHKKYLTTYLNESRSPIFLLKSPIGVLCYQNNEHAHTTYFWLPRRIWLLNAKHASKLPKCREHIILLMICWVGSLLIWRNPVVDKRHSKEEDARGGGRRTPRPEKFRKFDWVFSVGEIHNSEI